ncbi:MAG: hypothetical protein RXP97_01460 [Nitrososphaeria archaeon]
MRAGDLVSVIAGVAILFALATFPAGALIAGIVAGAIEGNAAKGFLAALAAGVIYALALTVLAAGAGPVAIAFEFYYAYVVDSVICAVGGLVGGWAVRILRRIRSSPLRGVPP